MPSPFETYDLKKALEAVTTAQLSDAADNRKFYEGEHWQNGNGWLGPKVLTGGADAMETIKSTFVSKNVVKEVVNRHTGAVVGQEPTWGLTVRRPLQEGEETTAQEQALINEAEALLTSLWDERGVHDVLQRATRSLLWGGRGAIRVFVPSGFVEVGEQGVKVPSGSLEQSLTRIFLHWAEPEQSTVLTDTNTQRQVGLYTYQDDKGKEFVELVYLDDEGKTVIKIIGSDGTQVTPPIDLGQHLTIYEMVSAPLITPQVRQQQAALNLALTCLPHNINLAGFVSRILFNADMPGREEVVNGVTRFVPDPIYWGAGTTNNFVGEAIYDEQGRMTGRATPNYVREEPVSPDTFIRSKDAMYEGILEETDQIYAIMSGDATASGKSRIEARTDFLRSIMRTVAQVNKMGRWLLETTLAMGAAFAGQPGRFASLRSIFECRIDMGSLGADEMRLIQELAGGKPLLSIETAQNRIGVQDTNAEQAKIAEEQDMRQVQQPVIAVPPPSINGQEPVDA